MYLRIYKNDLCHCCKDMESVISHFKDSYCIDVEYVYIDKEKVEMPSELSGLPFIELWDGDTRIDYFQGSTRYEIFESKFKKHLK